MSALPWNAQQHKAPPQKVTTTFFPFKMCKEFKFKMQRWVWFSGCWGIVDARRHNNNNNNKVSERLETSRAREKIDLVSSEMRPWTHMRPERQVKQEKQTCSNLFTDLFSPNLNILSIIAFGKINCVSGLTWGPCLKMSWNDGFHSSSKSHRQESSHWRCFQVVGFSQRRCDWMSGTHRSLSVTGEGNFPFFQDFTGQTGTQSPLVQQKVNTN